MARDELFLSTMGRRLPGAEAPTVEIVASAGQFATALLHRIASSILGDVSLAFSAAVTEAVRIDTEGRSRAALRTELRRFLKLSPHRQDIVIPVWLNLVGLTHGGAGRAISYAEQYGTEVMDTGRAILVGLDTERTETLCHIAGVTNADPFRLVCNAAQIEVNGKPIVSTSRHAGED